MPSNKTVLLISCFCCCFCASMAQNAYRPKIAEFSLETLSDYNANSISESLGDANTEIERDRLLNLKLGLPFYIKNGTVAGVQLKYARQQFANDEEFLPLQYDLYRQLEQRTFRSIGARFFYSNILEGTNGKITAIAGAEMKSDRLQWSRNSAKYFLTFGYDAALSKRKSLGAAVLFDYSLGVFSVYPILSYRHELGLRWTLDAKLPKSAELRYQLSDKWWLISKAQLRGWRYNLTALEDSRDFTLRKSDFQFTFSAEREIHDWLWLGVDLGFTKNINYYLADPGNRRRDALADLRSQSSEFFKIGLFIVPPGKFYQ